VYERQAEPPPHPKGKTMCENIVIEKAQMIDYYAKRAIEYETIFQKPERQRDLFYLRTLMSTSFANKDVLEIACGTGYWTQLIARNARKIIAMDCNKEVIEIARQKEYGSCDVDFILSDAYSMSNIYNGFSASFLGFWWSHVPIQTQPRFLQLLHSHLCHRAKVILIDNCFVEHGSTPVSRTDAYGNTFQLRRLKDGSEHEVLKNFPSDDALASAFAPFSKDLRIKRLSYYWVAEYEAK